MSEFTVAMGIIVGALALLGIFVVVTSIRLFRVRKKKPQKHRHWYDD